MSKITAEHLARKAYVYIRQSKPYQVKHNVESKRRQYGLLDRARELGWTEVRIIDEDQGHSGSGTLRSGFEQLLVEVCSGKVGAVLCIEGSRLARNGREWHTLLEFCGLVNTLLIDEDGIYDPRQPNDRLLLGMKGTISEMELSTFRQRAQGALDQKAKRGELHTTVSIGYVRTHGDRIEKDPDLRIREAIALVFRKFRELRSIRQVLIWIRQEPIELPVIINIEDKRKIVWQAPVYNTGRGELTLEEAAAPLSVSRMTVLRMIRSKLLPATQACLGAPWLIRKEDLQLRQEQLKNVPRTPDPNQLCMNLSDIERCALCTAIGGRQSLANLSQAVRSS